MLAATMIGTRGSFELSRPRTGQYEGIALVFLNEPVDDGKQLRNLLDFIDHETFLSSFEIPNISTLAELFIRRRAHAG